MGSRGSWRRRATLNGEIYNFVRLRETLRRLGHRFAMRSDTEVIAHACEEFRTPVERRVDVPVRIDPERGRVFDPAGVSRVLAEHGRGARNHARTLWSLLVFESWRGRYLGEGPLV